MTDLADEHRYARAAQCVRGTGAFVQRGYERGTAGVGDRRGGTAAERTQLRPGVQRDAFDRPQLVHGASDRNKRFR